MSLFTYYQTMSDKHPLFMEILRFVAVGVIATLVDYIISAWVLYMFNPDGYPTFLSFLGIGESPEPTITASIVSTGIGFIAGLIVNYLLSVFFVYVNKGNSKTAGGALMFGVLSTIGLGINLLGMWLIYNVSGLINSKNSMIWYWIVKIILTFIVLVYNYITRKLIIFRQKKNDNTNSQVKEYDEK